MFDAPDLAPMIAYEVTPSGWCGLTEEGEIFNVEGQDGRPITAPEKICCFVNGRAIGYRALPKNPSNKGLIANYKTLFDRGLDQLRNNDPHGALPDFEAARAIAPTVGVRHNYALTLLALGRWPEGFAEYAEVERTNLYMRPQFRAAIDKGLKRWRGEDLAGKRILLIHDHGFGDSIMMLRYVAVLQAMGADVVLQVPPELQRLAAQCAPVTDELIDADYFCSLLFLMEVLKQTPQTVPLKPYLKVEPDVVRKWKLRINGKRKNIGVAWTPGNTHVGDFDRAVPLAQLTQHLGDAELFSVQQQGADEAAACGVNSFEFEDFADCAALMSTLDEIVTIDTAAVHLAGAIGHQRISLLLGHWASWRWLSPLYQNIQMNKTMCSNEPTNNPPRR